MTIEIKKFIELLKEEQKVSYEEMIHIVSLKFGIAQEDVERICNKE